MPAIPVDSTVCPLCKQPNACRLAEAASCDEACWCKTERFGPALLARVPNEQRGRACICRPCVMADNASRNHT